MSYLVLARKWRPQYFHEVIGQSHVTRALQNALGAGRMAHALIFSGPRGVGKTSVARIVAKSLNCVEGPAPDPCNECDICTEITAGSCVDVNEIDGASNRGIDEIRQLREEIRFQPVLCRYRIYIIDEVHMLTNEAFNALLKTVEEPPPHAYFIFATTEPRKIPETIHSRCQHYEFRRLSESALQEHLDRIAREEGLDLPKEATAVIARQAQGSVRDSLSLLDQIAAYGARTYEEVCQALGVAGIATVEELASALLDCDAERALSVLERVYGLGVDMDRLVQDLLGFLRDLAVIRKVGQGSACALTELSRQRVAELSERFSQVSFFHLLQAMDMVAEAAEGIRRSQSPRTTVEILFLKMCSLGRLAEIDQVLDRLQGLVHEAADSQSWPRTGPVHTSGPSNRKDRSEQTDLSTPRPEDTSLTGTGMEGGEAAGGTGLTDESSPSDQAALWPKFVSFVQEREPGLGAILDSCVEVKPQDGRRLKVICERNFKSEMLCTREKTNQINRLASAFFNSPVEITFETTDAGTSRPGNAPDRKGRPAASANPREELVGNPLVQEAINIFQARISGVTLYNRRKNKNTRS